MAILVGFSGYYFAAEGSSVLATLYFILSVFSFVKFLLVIGRAHTLVKTKWYGLTVDRIAEVEEGTDDDISLSKGKLAKLKKIIGEKDYFRLAKLAR